MIRDLFEILSIAATFPTVALAMRVAYLFGWTLIVNRSHAEPEFNEAPKVAKVTKTDLMIGIVIGFCKDIGDNLYWLCPWSLSTIRSELMDWWVSVGVFSNLPIRQGLGILAAIYHIRKVPGSKWAEYLIWSSLLGVLYSMWLLWIRG